MNAKKIITAILSLVTSIIPLYGSVLYEFSVLDWDWNWDIRPDNSTPRDYNTESCLPFRLEVFKYGRSMSDPITCVVTVPRFRNASLIPAGLNTLSPSDNSKRGLLRPFPDWESNRLGNCSCLQSPTGVVIGRNQHLYVVDTGRVDVLTPSPGNLCPAKLVVFSLTGQLVESYEFPDSVASRTQNFLTDIVLDYVDSDYVNGPKFAYISDISLGGKIVIFDFTSKTSRAVIDSPNFPSRDLTLHGQDYTSLQSFPSLTLTPDFNFVYYSVTGYKKLWQIPTWALRSPNIIYYWRIIDSPFNFGALAADTSSLYYGALELDAIMRWKTGQDIEDQQTTEESVSLRTNSLVLKNWENLYWTSALRLYNEYNSVNVYYLSNKAHLFLTGTMNFTAPNINFRIGYI